MENAMLVIAVIFALLSVVLGVRLILKETAPGFHREHVFEWIVYPYMRRCIHCHAMEVMKNDEMGKELKNYLGFLDEYYKSNMFPKTAVSGYHAYQSGCCPLAWNDPIHDPAEVRARKGNSKA